MEGVLQKPFPTPFQTWSSSSSCTYTGTSGAALLYQPVALRLCVTKNTDHSAGQLQPYLQNLRRERNIREIFSMYDVSFAKLSERFFKTTSWPPVHMIADLVDGDHVFCLLYKVLSTSINTERCAHVWRLELCTAQ